MATVCVHAINRRERLALTEDGEVGAIVGFYDADAEECAASEAVFCVARFDAGFVPLDLRDFGPEASH